MRLIDADALPVLHLAGWDGETLDMVSKAAIDAAPTAQPTAQERHGHWRNERDCNGNDYRICPFCGKRAGGYLNFCSYCGARMDEPEQTIAPADQSGAEWADNPVLASAT